MIKIARKLYLKIILFTIASISFIAGAAFAGIPKDPTETWYENPVVKPNQKLTVFKEFPEKRPADSDPTHHWYYSGAPHIWQESEVSASNTSEIESIDNQNDPTVSWYDNGVPANQRK